MSHYRFSFENPLEINFDFDDVDVYALSIIPVDGVWNDWQGWESCNVSCGGGTQLRRRECHGPFFGGAECVGPEIDSRDCNTHECPSKLEFIFALNL